MKKILILLMVLTILIECNSSKRYGISENNESFISGEFLKKDTFQLVCKGYPEEESTGVARKESSQNAALLSAYHFVKIIFNDTVSPEKDGETEYFYIHKDYAVINFVVRKKGLKNRLRNP